MPDAPQLPEQIRGRSFLTVQALSTDGPQEELIDTVRRAGEVRNDVTGPTSRRRLSLPPPANPRTRRPGAAHRWR